MSAEDEVGFGRPPKRSRWKKGQSGNRGRKPRRAATTADIIEKLLFAPVDITENGTARRVTTLEAILLQLWRRELDGNRRALVVRLKYEELDRRKTEATAEITFADSPYTEACGATASARDDDGKN